MKTKIIFALALLGIAGAQTEPRQANPGALPPGVEYALVLPRSVLVTRAGNAQKVADIFALGVLFGDGDPVGAMRAQGRADALRELLDELDAKTEGEKP